MLTMMRFWEAQQQHVISQSKSPNDYRLLHSSWTRLHFKETQTIQRQEDKPRLIPNIINVSALVLNANTPAPFFCPFLDETTQQVSMSGALQLWIDAGQQRHHVVIIVIHYSSSGKLLLRKSCPPLGLRGTSSTFESLVTDLQIEYSRNALSSNDGSDFSSAEKSNRYHVTTQSICYVLNNCADTQRNL